MLLFLWSEAVSFPLISTVPGYFSVGAQVFLAGIHLGSSSYILPFLAHSSRKLSVQKSQKPTWSQHSRTWWKTVKLKCGLLPPTKSKVSCSPNACGGGLCFLIVWNQNNWFSEGCSCPIRVLTYRKSCKQLFMFCATNTAISVLEKVNSTLK